MLLNHMVTVKVTFKSIWSGSLAHVNETLIDLVTSSSHLSMGLHMIEAFQNEQHWDLTWEVLLMSPLHS